MARRKPVKEPWVRGLFKNWSWLDSIVGFCLGGPVWIPIGLWYFGYGTTAARLLNDWSHEVITAFLALILMGRIISVARWPRHTPLDYNKITFPGALSANAVTIILGFALLICTLALVAPGVLELLAQHQLK